MSLEFNFRVSDRDNEDSANGDQRIIHTWGNHRKLAEAIDSLEDGIYQFSYSTLGGYGFKGPFTLKQLAKIKELLKRPCFYDDGGDAPRLKVHDRAGIRKAIKATMDGKYVYFEYLS
jgi:hypothetical protein